MAHHRIDYDSLSGDYGISRRYSGLIFAALMIGHHFSISAFCRSASAAGVCWSREKISCAKSASRARTLGLAKVSTVAALSLAMMSFDVRAGAQKPNQILASRFGNPASSTVGISGAAARRRLAETA